MTQISRILFLIFIFGSSHSLATETQHSGIMLLAMGDVKAIARDQTERTLKRRSKFYVGDIIQVGNGGKAQIRFTDGTLLSLEQNTRVQIDDFSYSGNPSDSTNRNFITLLQGGFRTITGAVGKVNPDAHAVRTPVATIGVRGTVYSVNYNDDLDVGVFDGKVRVVNDSGRIEIGESGRFDFATVKGLNARPRGLNDQPQTLTVGNESSSPLNIAASGMDRQTLSDSASSLNDFSESMHPADAENIVTEQSITLDGTRLTSSDGIYTDTATPEFFGDTRLADSGFLTAKTYKTLGVLAGATRPATLSDPLLYMRATSPYDSNAEHIMVDTASDPVSGEPLYTLVQNVNTVSNYGTLPSGNTVQDSYVYTRFDGTQVVLDLHWGSWNTSFDTYTYTDSGTVVSQVNGDLYWISGTPTDPAVIKNLTGTVTYADVSNIQGSTSGGLISGTSTASLNVNFDTSAVDGTMSFQSTDASTWDLAMAGNLSGADIDFITVTGTVSSTAGSALTGDGAAMLVGPSAEAMGGSFTVADSVNGDWAQGTFAIGCGTTGCP